MPDITGAKVGISAALSDSIPAAGGYSLVDTVASATVAEGSDTAFAATVAWVSVYSTADVYFAKTQAEAEADAGGALEDRLFCAAGERRQLPWDSRSFWIMNVSGTDTSTVRVDGWNPSS